MHKGKRLVGLGLMAVLLGTPAVTVLEARSGQAQATDPQKEEADQFLKLCREQLQKRQYEAATQACQEVADSLRQWGNRYGEARSAA